MSEPHSITAIQESFDSTLREIAAHDKRRQHNANILTVALILLAAFWLGFSAWQAHRLQVKADSLAAQSHHFEGLIDTDKVVLNALLPLLRSFGWTGDIQPEKPNDIARIVRSVQADDKLVQLQLSDNPPRAWNTELTYYPKDVDGTKVSAALRNFGFRFQNRPPLVPDVPCNDVVFGAETNPDEARIVAYVLIRAGVDIKGIHRSNLAAKKKVIQVIANRIVAEGPPLSVDQIARMSTFDADPNY